MGDDGKRRRNDRGTVVALIARRGKSFIHRCPACGQRIESPVATRCPLCDYTFGDDRVTGADVTPYSKAYACGEPGWRRMSEWIWFAGSGRLKHLALMRTSAASRRFALINLLLLSGGLGLADTSRIGWHRTLTRSPFEVGAKIDPAGQGWIRVAVSPGEPRDHAVAARRLALWWNPAQTVIVAVAAAAAGLIATSLGLLLARIGITLAHAPRFREEQRMTAAIHYSTSWSILVSLGAVALALRPISYIAAVRSWRWFPPSQSFLLASATMSGIGLVLWWFWLVRLGSTAPRGTRARVTGVFAFGAPVLAAVLFGGWWFGLERLYPVLFDRLNLSF